MSEATRIGICLTLLAGLLAAVIVPRMAHAQSSPCGPRADVERELTEGHYTERASGQDVRGNRVAWHQNPGGEWAIVVTPAGQDSRLCVVATGGPGVPADGVK